MLFGYKCRKVTILPDELIQVVGTVANKIQNTNNVITTNLQAGFAEAGRSITFYPNPNCELGVGSELIGHTINNGSFLITSSSTCQHCGIYLSEGGCPFYGSASSGKPLQWS